MRYSDVTLTQPTRRSDLGPCVLSDAQRSLGRCRLGAVAIFAPRSPLAVREFVEDSFHSSPGSSLLMVLVSRKCSACCHCVLRASRSPRLGPPTVHGALAPGSYATLSPRPCTRLPSMLASTSRRELLPRSSCKALEAGRSRLGALAISKPTSRGDSWIGAASDRRPERPTCSSR